MVEQRVDLQEECSTIDGGAFAVSPSGIINFVVVRYPQITF